MHVANSSVFAHCTIDTCIPILCRDYTEDIPCGQDRPLVLSKHHYDGGDSQLAHRLKTALETGAEVVRVGPDGTVVPLTKNSDCQAVVRFTGDHGISPEQLRGTMIRVLVLIYLEVTAKSAVALPTYVVQQLEVALRNAHRHWQSGREKECSTAIKEASKLICEALGGALVPPAQAKMWAEIIDFLNVPEPSFLDCMNMLALLAESSGAEAESWVVPVSPTTTTSDKELVRAMQGAVMSLQRYQSADPLWEVSQKHSQQIAELEQRHSKDIADMKHEHSKEIRDTEKRMEEKYLQRMSKLEQGLQQLLVLAMGKDDHDLQLQDVHHEGGEEEVPQYQETQQFSVGGSSEFSSSDVGGHSHRRRRRGDVDNPPKGEDEQEKPENKPETPSKWNTLLTYGAPIAVICIGGVFGAGIGASALAGSAVAAKVGSFAAVAKVTGMMGVKAAAGKVGAGVIGGVGGSGAGGVVDFFFIKRPCVPCSKEKTS